MSYPILVSSRLLTISLVCLFVCQCIPYLEILQDWNIKLPKHEMKPMGLISCFGSSPVCVCLQTNIHTTVQPPKMSSLYITEFVGFWVQTSLMALPYLGFYVRMSHETWVTHSQWTRVNLNSNRTDHLYRPYSDAPAGTAPLPSGSPVSTLIARPDFLPYLAYHRPILPTPLA